MLDSFPAAYFIQPSESTLHQPATRSSPWSDGQVGIGSTAVSAPVLSLSTKGFPTINHGTAAVTVLQTGFTDGYTARYSATTNRWTLTEKSTGNPVTADLDGNTWTLTLLNRVTFVITKGTAPFRAGDQFDFSVFSSQQVSTSGSQHLWLDTWDVTGPP